MAMLQAEAGENHWIHMAAFESSNGGTEDDDPNLQSSTLGLGFGSITLSWPNKGYTQRSEEL